MDYVPLPKQFIGRMNELLKDETVELVEALGRKPMRGLRCNGLKLAPQRLEQLLSFRLRKVPWTTDGFYIPDDDDIRPGRHPFHAAGLYYIQEPSAMLPAEALQVEPGHRVLDLCAAPGGKTTKIAVELQGKGWLLANEIHPERVRILEENIVRFGINNAVVTKETPERLSKKFPNFFDRVLVDAPCSGEGMFRKDMGARLNWSEGYVEACSVRQRDILKEAVKMVRAGGRLVYSTCTFAPEENEQIVAWLLSTHPDFCLVDPGTIRLWPHRVEGEGHFVAVFERMRDIVDDGSRLNGKSSRVGRKPSSRDATAQTLLQQLGEWAVQRKDVLPEVHGNRLYLVPKDVPDLAGLAVLSPGWHIGNLRSNRVEPSHALALGLHVGEGGDRVDVQSNDPKLTAYMRGEALPSTGEKGWVVVGAEGFPLGFAKRSDGWLKNHYPKMLRTQR